MEQAQDEFKTLVERLPDPKAKKFCLSRAMEAFYLTPVLKKALSGTTVVRDYCAYLAGGLKIRQEEATA
ncbi:MAG: hypothetical protein HQK60_01810 [Deltaproteobacteria bacterium]|nr:hypothetical protein [Deltaproteobacteria bacterium]